MAKLKITDNNNMPNLIEEINKLKNSKIEVGVFGGKDSEILMIARVHEFGVTITPKKAKALTIPLNEEAAGKSARDFDNLFLMDPDDDGDGILAMEVGDRIRPMYVLTKKVEIPERSYIREGFDKNLKKIQKHTEQAIRTVIAGRMTANKALNLLGAEFASFIRKYMVEIKSPPNSAVTQKNKKGANNPLIDSGRLRQSITHRVR